MDRSDFSVVACTLASVALVLTAPVLGRNGLRGVADLTTALGALAGISAFALVMVDTLRSSRRKSDR